MGASSSTEGSAEEMSYWQMARAGYDELVNAIIRPPRSAYSISALGPQSFQFGGRRFSRHDLTLVNERGLTLQCSHWQPVQRSAEQLPCVIYVHGNSSSRTECIGSLAVCLSIGATVFAFDFAGSGKSEGRYVSLGWYERDDLRVVVDHLRGSGTVSTLAVWGRSMGAVTGLLYQVRDLELLGHMSVDAMILDSPFADFCQLAEELVDKGKEHGVHVPKFVLRMALHMMSGSVQKAAGFDIAELVPIKHVDKCTVPALFVTAESDDFISPAHAEQLYEAYAGPKNLVLVDGDHNSPRGGQCLHIAAAFLAKHIKLPKEWGIPDKERYYGTLPWSQAASDSSGSHTSGLTRERQVDIESKVYSMFGGRRKNGSSGSKGVGAGNAAGGSPASASAETNWRLDQAYYYCNRGNALEEAGNMDGAIRSYRAAISYMPSYADAYYNLAIALKREGKLQEAIVEYQNAIRYKPAHADAHNNLGVVFEELGRVQDAVKCYTKACKAKPEHAEAHCNLADALQNLGRLEDAVREYQIAISYNSQDSDAINNMGVAMEALGQIDTAIQAYTTAIAHSPEHWDAHCNLADALHARRQLEPAIAEYRKILRAFPDDANLHSSLGNALHSHGQVAESITCYSRALALNPTDSVTYNNLGIALQTTGAVEESIEAYENAIKYNPKYAIAHYNLGVAKQSLDQLNLAVSAYHAAIKLQPNYPDAYNNMGFALMTMDRLDEAISAFKQAIKYRKDFPSAKENLATAMSQKKTGKTSGARKGKSTEHMSSLSGTSTAAAHQHRAHHHQLAAVAAAAPTPPPTAAAAAAGAAATAQEEKEKSVEDFDLVASIGSVFGF